MKYYFKDVVFTLLVKGILLYLFMVFLCKTHTLLLAKWPRVDAQPSFSNNSSPQDTFSQQTKGVTNDKQHSR